MKKEMNQKVEELSMEDLDKMSKKKINEHRSKYIQSKQRFSKNNNRYLKELEIYLDIRFKEDVLARYDKWINVTEDHYDYKAIKFMANMILKQGKEQFHRFSVYSDLSDLNFEMHFIKMNFKYYTKYFGTNHENEKYNEK